MSIVNSSKSNPCPVCNRDKDGDCRITEFGNLVFCHSHQDGNKGDELNGYTFIYSSDKGAGWGVWGKITDKENKPIKRDKPAVEKEQIFYYHDRDGSPLIRVHRQKGREPEFWQSYFVNGVWITAKKVPDSLRESMRSRVPIYRYEEVQEALSQGKQVIWVEGETSADALWSLGIPATTSIAGCKAFTKWGDYSQDLNGVKPVICPDRDKVGLAYAQEVAEFFGADTWLYPLPKSPLWKIELPPDGGLDIEDWLADGSVKTKEDIEAAIGYDPFKKPESSIKESKEEEIPLDYNLILDKIDELEASIEDEHQLLFECSKFAHENKLTSRIGFNGAKLLQLARARKDSSEAIEIIDSHAIIDDDTYQDWLITGVVPQGVVIVMAGCGGDGKTSFWYDIAKHLATGSEWSDYPTKQCKTLIIQTDEPKINIKQKLRVARFKKYVPENTVHFITQWKFTKWKLTEKAIRANGYGLVIIDSWTAANAGTGVDLTKSNAGDPAYLLRDLANELGITIVVIHHLNKEGGYRDSSALYDNVSEPWTIKRGEKKDGYMPEDRILEIKKSRAGLEGSYLLRMNAIDYSWGHHGEIATADDVGGEPLIAKIRRKLQGAPWDKFSARDIVREFDCTHQKAEAELQRLVRHGLVSDEWVIWDKPVGDSEGYWNYCWIVPVKAKEVVETTIAVPPSSTPVVEVAAVPHSKPTKKATAIVQADQQTTTPSENRKKLREVIGEEQAEFSAPIPASQEERDEAIELLDSVLECSTWQGFLELTQMRSKTVRQIIWNEFIPKTGKDYLMSLKTEMERSA